MTAVDPTLRPAAGALDIAALRSARLRSLPFQWTLLDHALTPDYAERLLATFPTAGFWQIEDHDGEKSYAYAARPLVTLGAREPVAATDLDPAWHKLAEELAGDDYRAALGALIGRSLDDAVMEASIWRWGPGHHLGPHRDMENKIVTQVFYFSDEWRAEWGGTLQILRSKDDDDVFFDVMPDNGSSSILVRSERSWHGVSRIADAAPVPRRSLIVTWFRANAESPVWAVDDDGQVRCTVGVAETAPPPIAQRPVSTPLHDAAPVGVLAGHAASPRRGSRTGRRIGMVGTFDVENLGDLLFPLVAEHELSKRLGDVDLRLYSYRRMSGDRWPYDVDSLGHLPEDIAGLDALLVGGGEIVHAIETIAPGYRPSDPDVHHPLGLWLTPTLLAAAGGIPIAWNAPGAVDGLPESITPLVESALESVAYAAVRDARSARILSALAPRVPLHVVPDTVFGIGALLPDAPSPAFLDLIEQLGVGDNGYIVVQPTAQLRPFREHVVELVERAAAEGRSVMELPIGPIHGDAAGLLDLPVPTITPTAWPDPLLLAELIARADGLIAQSLHASIIATTRGVPVFRPPAGGDSKHEILEGRQGVCILGADAGAVRFGRTQPIGEDPSEAKLARHWDRVADALCSPATRAAAPSLLSLVAAMPHIADVRPETPPAPVEAAPPTVRRDQSRFVMSVGARVHAAPLVSIVIPTLHRIDLLEVCLDTIDRYVAGKVAHETIVVANGTALDVLHPIQHRDDVVLLRSRVNRGFAGACNWAVEHARGEYVVLLNDDVQVTPHWLEYLVATASRQGVGAVGSRVLLPDGTVQEAGSVIWQDGSTHGIGRGLPAESRAHRAVRDVDYASGCALMLSRAAWNAVGGMDESYFPAYYEDADLCMRLRDAGFRVVVDPRAAIVHGESASSDQLSDRDFLNVRNRATFVSRWGDRLGDCTPPGATDLDLAIRQSLHRAGGGRPRLLLIDDLLPDPSYGSGFGRMFVAVSELAAGNDITLIPRWGGDSSVALRLAELGVEIAWEHPQEHLSRWAHWYDAVLVSRPGNFRECVDAVRRHQPAAALIYDAEALWHRRFQRQAALATDADERVEALRQAADMEELERAAAAAADHVICLSTDEAAMLSAWKSAADVSLIPPFDPATRDTGAGFASRRDVLFTGAWRAGPGSPNVDALRFFVEDVLPLLVGTVPDVRLVVTGGAPPAEVVALESPHVTVVGHVPDLSSAFAHARVVVVPTRVGAGVKLKTIDALQHGVPVVATTVGAEGVDYGDAQCVAVHDDPQGFARAVATLLTDAQAWQSARDAALRFAHVPEQQSGVWTAALAKAIAARTAHEECTR